MVATQHNTAENETIKFIRHKTDLNLGSNPESLEYEGYAINPSPNFSTLPNITIRSLLICRHTAHTPN